MKLLNFARRIPERPDRGRIDEQRSAIRQKLAGWSVRQRLSILLMLVALIPNSAQAVVISTGSGNTTGAGTAYFNAVGKVNNSSAVYLGNGWVISALHVAKSATTVTFNGVAYGAASPGTNVFTVVPDNPANGSATADLALFKILPKNGNFPSQSLPLTTAEPSLNTSVTAVGWGQGAAGSLLHWDVTPAPPGPSFTSPSTWAAVATPDAGTNAAGYNLDGIQDVTERWGQSTTASDFVLTGGADNSTRILVSVGSITLPNPSTTVATNSIDIMTRYYTSYANEQSSSNPNQFLLTAGDSGGALVDGSGRLVAISEAVQPYVSQKGTADFGDYNFAVDIYDYRIHINAITGVPEPSSFALAAIGFAGLTWRLRRRRARSFDTMA